jgi:putative drug exporter of the RND superfamily
MSGDRSESRRAASTVRIALWSAHHGWLVACLWIMAMLGLFLANAALGGTVSQSAMGASDAKTESELGYEAFQNAGQSAEGQGFWLVLLARDAIISNHQQEVADIAATLQGATAVLTNQTQATPVFSSIVNPFETQAPGAVASDGSAVLVTGFIPGSAPEVEDRVSALIPVLAQVRTDYPDFQVLALNNTLVNREVGELVNSDLDGSLKLTMPITFIILLIAFGALIAAFVPIVQAIFALLGAFGLVGLYSHLVEPVSQYVGQIIVLIGLAVAVDYSLFLISRVRRERRAGKDRYEAIEAASATAGRAIFFSGIAVMISLGGLLVMNNSIFRSIALGTICVVLISVIGSLTFLPALLGLLGGGIDRFRLPIIGRQRPEGTGAWGRLVLFATRHPWPVALVTAAVLLAAASPVARLRLGTMSIDGLPNSLQSVTAWQVMAQKWPEGTTLTLDTYVTGADQPATQAAIQQYVQALPQVPGIGQAQGIHWSGDSTVADIAYTLPGNANDQANWDVVQRVRSETVPAAFGGLTGVSVYVSGDAAAALDNTQLFGGQTPIVIGFVLCLSFLLLLVVFHSIVIPTKAILLNLLSAGAAFGVMQLVFQDGWFKDFLGITPSPVESWIPPMVFTILFGLSMDYHVFILTRVKEARDRGLASVDAVVKGISVTSGTVTSAAAIMVAVFAVFVSLHFVIIRQMGLGLAVAVFVDATIVRSLLLPASMKLLGDWNWYMPRWLDWIPRVTIEGEPEERLSLDGRPAEADETRNRPVPPHPHPSMP